MQTGTNVKKCVNDSKEMNLAETLATLATTDTRKMKHFGENTGEEEEGGWQKKN